MKKDENGWIDPAIAKRLMLEYQNAIGIKGASEIERRIHEYAKPSGVVVAIHPA